MRINMKFKDAPHFQKTFGKTTAQLRELRGKDLYPLLSSK